MAVTGLALTPVKATRLREVEQIRLDRAGVRENRRFLLIDRQGRRVNASRLGELQRVVSDYCDEDRTLRLELPDGRVLEDRVVLGAPVRAQMYREDFELRLVEGPWAQAVSELVGQPLRLVEAGEESAVDRGARGAATVISRGSLKRLATEGALDGIDGRRFRMLIEVDGLDAHGEDAWVGQSVRIGEAVVAFEGNVGRCVITTRTPETGSVDARTLKLLGRYRREVESTEPLPFGVYGRVVEPGVVRVGDPVVVEG